MIDHEPPISADDTQPRPLVIVPLERPTEAAPDESEARGCSNPLLIAFVMLSFLVLFVATVGLAALAGYRDGVNDADINGAKTRVAAVNTQRAYIITDLQAANWESALARCQYVATLQPGDPNISKCIQDSQRALSATATPTQTALPPTQTPTPVANITAQASATPNPGGSTFDPQEWYARAQEEVRNGQLEAAQALLEAVHDTDPTFNQKEVEGILCSTYETLGNQYDNEGRLSEMVIVIKKAIKLSCRLTPSKNWPFTINAAQLYLDAKAYLDAGNYRLASIVFRRLMALTTTYQRTLELGCQAFAKAGDADSIAASKQYNCP